MKTAITLSLCLLFFCACKQDIDSLEKFPDTITISNSGCLQNWEELNFVSVNYGSKVYRFDAKAWFGVDENIATPPNKFDYFSGGDGFKFYIPVRNLDSANYIHVRLTGYGDNGLFGESKVYKFKKNVVNDCVKWVDY